MAYPLVMQWIKDIQARFSTAGRLLLANMATSTAVNTVLRVGTANDSPAYEKVNLATDVTGKLPVANIEGGGALIDQTPKGSRSTLGNWTISGLVPYRPLYILLGGNDADPSFVQFMIVSGVLGQNKANVNNLGHGNVHTPSTYFIVPTGASVVLNITQIVGTGAVALAYQ